MQIQAIQNSNNKLNFGMGVKISPEAQKYISDNFSERQLKKLSKVIDNQKTNPYDIYLSTNTELVATGLSPDYKPIYKRVKHLYAIVKEKYFRSNMFFDTPILVIKRAEKYANKLQKG
ncbi:MAG: hypothetical protein KIC88_10395 [Acinetobacter sp.]|nr:hypothetical protein [Acinetobacter sp.]